MCHYPKQQTTAKSPVYNNYQRYNAPLFTAPTISRNHAINGANTYWRLSFFNRNGEPQTVMMIYNYANDMNNFLEMIKDSIKSYGVRTVESATILAPSPRPVSTPSHMLIANQRQFTRALSLIPSNEDMFNPMRGIPVRVDCRYDDEKKDEGASLDHCR